MGGGGGGGGYSVPVSYDNSNDIVTQVGLVYILQSCSSFRIEIEVMTGRVIIETYMRIDDEEREP